MFQILEKVSNLSSNECSDYAIAKYLNIIKQALNIIHIIVPIILIVMGTVQLIKLMTNPDDQGGKEFKSLINKIIATVIVFLIPYIVNIAMSFVSDEFEISRCWNNAYETAEEIK